MTVTTDEEFDAEAAQAVGRNWWMLLGLGIVSIVVGIFIVQQPETATAVAALLFAIFLLVSGIFQIVRAFAHGLSGGLRALTAISGVISLLLGFIALRAYFDQDNVLLSGFILAIFIGISFLFRGLAELMMGIASKGEQGRGWLIFAGIVFIVAGGVVIAMPASIVAIFWIIGIWLIVMGIFEIISAFIVRKAAA